jgi:hypothetical protein
MNGFTPAPLASQPPDPTKHVNYTLGMVLGVDDLNQEFAYLAGRDQWMVRDLIGYGTAWGLAVGIDLNAAGHQEVRVSAGVAADPRGRLIRVAPAQCADLDDWLANHTGEVNHWVREDGTLDLYLVLSYRDCQSDLVPIAGEPCRSVDEMMQPSRVTDSFMLELRFTPPRQIEEDAIVDLFRWLPQHLELVASGGASLEDVLASVRAAVVDTIPPTDPNVGPPDSSPPTDFLLDSSPAARIQINRSDYSRYLDAILLLWVTELRPRWRPNWLGDTQGCDLSLSPPQVTDADSVLLAKLTLPLTREMGSTTWEVAGSPPVGVDQERRPRLLHLRFLQEWLNVLTEAATANSGGGGGGSSAAVERPAATRVAMVAAGRLSTFASDHTQPPDPPGAAPMGGLKISDPVVPSADGRASIVRVVYNFPTLPGTVQPVVQVTADGGAMDKPDLLSVTTDSVAGGSFNLRVSKDGKPLTNAEQDQLTLNVQVLEYAL